MSITERVRALNLPLGSYAVFGSGPLEAHGLRTAKDIDLIVTSDFFRKCKHSGEWQAEKLKDHHEVLTKGDVSMYDSWAPDSWDIAQMIQEAEVIDGVPFVKLETVLEWKKIRNSEKDKEDIKLLEKKLGRK